MSKRNPVVFGMWGPHGSRVITAESGWRKPLSWNRKAAREGQRHRVFCGHRCDIFEDRPEVVEARERLFDLIEKTPHLDWQLLTKRPDNILDMVPDGWLLEGFPANVWAMVSVEDQEQAEQRIPYLLRVPAPVRGLSVEPLLERVDLAPWLATGEIHWVIVGGESGSRKKARPCHLDWIHQLVKQCRQAAVPVFVKQVGRNPVSIWGKVLRLKHPKGGDPDEWSPGLRVREMPG
jgi:protein gp37